MTVRYGIAALLLLLPILTAQAEPGYITDKLKVGLHQDNLPDSPITQVLPSGTPVEVVKREDKASLVRTASGVTGWVDNSYLAAEAPASERLNTLSARNAVLEQQLKSLQSGGGAGSASGNDLAKLSGDYATLQQQYRSEQLKNGELEVTIAELRKRLGQDNNTEVLYKELDTLRATNKALEIKLAAAPGGAGTTAAVTAEATAPASLADTAGHISFSWKNLLILILVLLGLGLGGGIYMMDYFNRRKHGGFRI